MDDEKKQTIFENNYANTLNLSYQEWLEQGPKTEEQAYEWLNEIDRELNISYDVWFDARGRTKDILEEKREKLKAMYNLIEETFGLGIADIEK